MRKQVTIVTFLNPVRLGITDLPQPYDKNAAAANAHRAAIAEDQNYAVKRDQYVDLGCEIPNFKGKLLSGYAVANILRGCKLTATYVKAGEKYKVEFRKHLDETVLDGRLSEEQVRKVIHTIERTDHLTICGFWNNSHDGEDNVNIVFGPTQHRGTEVARLPLVFEPDGIYAELPEPRALAAPK